MQVERQTKSMLAALTLTSGIAEPCLAQLALQSRLLVCSRGMSHSMASTQSDLASAGAIGNAERSGMHLKNVLEYIGPDESSERDACSLP